MEEKTKCLCGSSDVVLSPVLGESNVSQIANQAALEFFKSEYSWLFCVAGVGAHIKGMVKSAKEADLIVAIDGCRVQCAAKLCSMQRSNLPYK